MHLIQSNDPTLAYVLLGILSVGTWCLLMWGSRRQNQKNGILGRQLSINHLTKKRPRATIPLKRNDE